MMRRMLLVVHGQALAELLRPSVPAPWLRVSRPTVPPDAVYCGVWADPLDGCVYLGFEHPSFAEVPPGQPIPRLDPPGWEARAPDEADTPHVVGAPAPD